MEKEIYYFHGTTLDGYRFTIAGEYITDLMLRLSVAICSKTDRFERLEGRNRSLERLETLEHSLVKSYPATYLPGEPRKIFVNAAAKFTKFTKSKLSTKFGFQS